MLFFFIRYIVTLGVKCPCCFLSEIVNIVSGVTYICLISLLYAPMTDLECNHSTNNLLCAVKCAYFSKQIHMHKMVFICLYYMCTYGLVFLGIHIKIELQIIKHNTTDFIATIVHNTTDFIATIVHIYHM